ncbi:MAG TPA: type I-U CRISPR-associated helicase/endonuclease Cas3 [Vicinamibacterales bacterium]|nr:type I-U CRISPR-associated helicase/endonuclease Cas3 [Vicinamibacterales bacterium]
MAELPHLDVAEFTAFFEAIHGHPPFPWQRRLARLVVDEGWPPVLDLPTGTGKTAALDVALFALALHAGRMPVPAPRRIVFVVDRRTIVDQAYDRALKIRDSLMSPRADVLRRVRERLASVSTERHPLHVVQMRGGVARDDRWARTPDQPLIAVSTVDQVGSRLLFRGYGVTDGMKPVHAGLLGHDVLYLLDEVHLSQPFQETLAAIGTRYREWRNHQLPGGFHVVEMSATPGAQENISAFTLDDDDRADRVLAARLETRKPAMIRLPAVPARNFQQELQKQLLAMLEAETRTVAVVVNRVASARECHAQLHASLAARGVDVCLLTGRMRPYDRAEIEARVLPRIRAGRDRRPEDRPIVIVATQSIEAGADFDFDGLVTECASLDALRQRFGRLDRLGALRGGARGVIVARTDTLKDDAVYGDALGATWRWLEQAATNGIVDFGLDALSLPGPEDLVSLLAPKAHAPILLPSHLDAWVQTSPRPDPDPDIALWLHGPQRGQADVQVVWRADLDEALVRTAVNETGEWATIASERALNIVEAVRPCSAEAMPVPFAAARRWLLGLSEPHTADLEGVPVVDEDERESPAYDRPAVLWQGEASQAIRVSDLRPGQTIVVPASYGGILHGNWAPASLDPVVDVAETAAWRSGRAPALRLHPAVLAQHALTPPLLEGTDAEAPEDRDVARAWLEGLGASGTALPFSDVVAELLKRPRGIRVERLLPGVEEGNGQYLVVRGRRISRSSVVLLEEDPATDDGTTGSFTGTMVTLAAHTDGVVRTVDDYARRLGISEDIAGAMRIAAAWHDAGKADVRFQRWLHGGSEFKALAQPEPLAKSSGTPGRAAMRLARHRAGYPEGTRHELMSVALMDSARESLAGSHDRALVWHLVSSHHGRSRPFAPWAQDPSPVDVVWQRDGVSAAAASAHRLERLDSGVADRFWDVVRGYGWWGAAWLEAVFRLADHRQSEREQGSEHA